MLEPLSLIFSGPTSTGGRGGGRERELNRDELKTVQLRGQGRVNFQVQRSPLLFSEVKGYGFGGGKELLPSFLRPFSRFALAKRLLGRICFIE